MKIEITSDGVTNGESEVFELIRYIKKEYIVSDNIKTLMNNEDGTITVSLRVDSKLGPSVPDEEIPF